MEISRAVLQVLISDEHSVVFTAAVSTISWKPGLLGVSQNMQRMQSFKTKFTQGQGFA